MTSLDYSWKAFFKLSSKSSSNICGILGIFEKCHDLCRQHSVYFLGNFCEKLGYFKLHHLVTLPWITQILIALSNVPTKNGILIFRYFVCCSLLASPASMWTTSKLTPWPRCTLNHGKMNLSSLSQEMILLKSFQLVKSKSQYEHKKLPQNKSKTQQNFTKNYNREFNVHQIYHTVNRCHAVWCWGK